MFPDIKQMENANFVYKSPENKTKYGMKENVSVFVCVLES